MLVVIAIIGILAALIGSAVMKSTVSASRTDCLNNLRQIGAGLHIYVMANNHRLPYCTMRPSVPPAGEENLPGIAEVLLPHAGGNALLFRCPDDPGGKFFHAEATSYEWQSALVNGKAMNPQSLKLLGINRPVMFDYDNFHQTGTESQKNYLYADGRALPEPELE